MSYIVGGIVDFADKVVVVTGGGNGIGRQVGAGSVP
jgi:hypothetical protein